MIWRKIIQKKFSIRNMESSKNKEATRKIIEQQIAYESELEHGIKTKQFYLGGKLPSRAL